MIFQKEYRVGVRDISNSHEATNKALLKYLESIACRHSDDVGYGINDISTKKVVWILMDWKFKVLKRPKYGQTINVRTWSRKIDRCSAYRDFEIVDKENNILAIATSKWVLLDSDTRKLIRIPENIANEYDSETDKNVFEEEIEKMHEPENKDISMQLKIRRTDIDINYHVNNLNYLDLAYEILPIQEYEKNLNNIRITYKHQTSPEETVNIYYAKIDDKNIVTIKNIDNSQIHAIVELW